MRQLFRCQTGGNRKEPFLIGTGTRQQETDAACIEQDHRPDLEQLEAQGIDSGMRELRTLQHQPADGLQQGVGEAGEQHSELIRPPGMATRAVREKIQLLFLDAVLHIPTRTAQRVVERLRIASQVRHHIAWVAPPGEVLPSLFVQYSGETLCNTAILDLLSI